MSIMRDKGHFMRDKGHFMRDKGHVMRYKGHVMRDKGHVMRYRGLVMRDKDISEWGQAHPCCNETFPCACKQLCLFDKHVFPLNN